MTGVPDGRCVGAWFVGVAALVTLVLAVAGCNTAVGEDAASDPPRSALSTEGDGLAVLLGTWLLDEVMVSGEPFELDASLTTVAFPGAAMWVRFDANGRLSGAGPCNDFQGTYRVDGTTLTPEDITLSAVACDPPTIMEAEAAIVTAFETDELEVSTPDPNVLRLTAVDASRGVDTVLTLIRAP